MRLIPNNVLSTLVRCLPLVLDNVVSNNLRVINAVRQLKIIHRKLKKINDEQQSNNQS